jgi:hypothetical protein
MVLLLPFAVYLGRALNAWILARNAREIDSSSNIPDEFPPTPSPTLPAWAGAKKRQSDE